MARADWKSVMVRKELLLKAKKAAKKHGFPNVTRYIDHILRADLDRETPEPVETTRL